MSSPNRFLLIKAWGAGFWSDMEHVLGQLLIAELSERIPIVYWGKNSVYSGAEDTNAFEQFFLPVSAYSIHDLIRSDFTFYPEPWKFNNLFYEEGWPEKTVRTYYPLHTLYDRCENVLVSDCWLGIYLMEPIIKSTHPAFGLELDDIYRSLISKYIRLQPDIEREIDDFYNANLLGKTVLAVHVRGSDKIRELGKLYELNNLYYSVIDHCLEENPAAFIFLLTESEDILAEYKSLYKEKLIYTDCQRTSNDHALFWAEGIDKRRMGIEILKDTYLAARCDSFIGNAHSNVSTAVKRLKQWPPNSLGLFSEKHL
ncbi:MAG TPA: O-fucosyltransferase family protein [Methylomusa anaerophila]|uniref:Glycosyl transferase family 11 n=1 Tax=Methylomusa anaerophila TaxID=1930071 RepID=A0A348AG81_9FIRM|nr:O-fucosyltransferase family protein [Methylomusa anaerophila]BBB90079.1 hypothetical protein MAMMFC1_00727 [Methylomusa anaerophila]HML88196.1 O-fucosyltransferase family protein [Methylomusa anaerophila]